MSEQPLLREPYNQLQGLKLPSTLKVPLSEGQGNPSHYDGYKVLDFIESASLPFLEGNVVKYVCRHAKKNGAKDIDKAIDYLNQIKRLRYSEPNSK